MPAYDYKCESCQEIIDQFKSISERENPDPCTKCGSKNVKQLFGKNPIRIGDPVHLGIKKNDTAWTEVLQRIKQGHPGGNGIKIR